MAVDRLAVEFEITYRCRGCDESAPDWKAIVHLGGCETPLIVEGGPIELDHDELVRRLAKVRERAIQVAGSQRWCGLCHGHSDRIRPGISLFWQEGQPERHTPDCPAAPMEDTRQ